VPVVTTGNDDDDVVEFLKSLGLNGAVGYLELSITGVPLVHVVAAGTHYSFVVGFQHTVKLGTEAISLHWYKLPLPQLVSRT